MELNTKTSYLGFKPFRVIGIGATFSPNLKANLYEASRLAMYFGAKLVLIHVGEHTQEKYNKFNAILAPFIKEGLEHEVIFTPGDPVEVILQTTDDLSIDLLIIGALQRENFLNYYVGSIARKITRKAKCSILLLIKPSIDRITCNHIVVNGLEDPKTKQTMSAAFYVSHKLGSGRLTIVEEISREEVAVNVEDDITLRKATIAREKLSRRENSRVQEIIDTIPEEYKQKVNIKTQPIFGRRGYSIGHYAEVVRADLLVMNAPSKVGFWDRLFPHDIEHILTELPTDVLIVQ